MTDADTIEAAPDPFKHSPERTALLKHKASREMVAYMEKCFPGSVALGPSLRNRVMLIVEGTDLIFSIHPDKTGALELTFKAPAGFRKKDVSEILWKYMYHRAAEAMLAVRNGHLLRAVETADKKRRKTKADA